MPPVIHIAGRQVQIGRQLRQRCSWCGALLEDHQLGAGAGDDGNPGPPMWEPGALVALDGNASYVVEHEDGKDLPPGACGLLDHSVTA
jgi:hypothetical protein